MKGQFTVGTIVIVGIIAVITIILLIVIPFTVLKYHMVVDLNFVYEYNSAEQLLLTLLSSKYNSTHTYYRVLAENDQAGISSFGGKFQYWAGKFAIPSGSYVDIYLFVPYDQKWEGKWLVRIYRFTSG